MFIAEPGMDRKEYANPGDLAEALAQSVAEDLARDLSSGDLASLAVSGGNTPKRFLEALSAHDLDWQKIFVTLVDERWVPEGNARSNAGLLKRHLLINLASKAQFIPLFQDTPTPQSGLEMCETELQRIVRPFSAVVLGMGTDGHTASFFPGGDNLTAALDTNNDALAIPMQAPGADEPRITLTFSALLDSARIYLHIEGNNKAETLAEALKEGPVEDMPVRAVLRQNRVPVHIYWAPD